MSEHDAIPPVAAGTPEDAARAERLQRIADECPEFNDNAWIWMSRAQDGLREAVRALTAASSRVTLAWQPIETAPKDGRWFLGWNEDVGHFVWRDGPGLLTGEDPAPTHWMPLTAPNEAADATHAALIRERDDLGRRVDATTNIIMVKNSEIDALRGSVDTQRQIATDLRRERDALRAALEKYGKHKAKCRSHLWEGETNPKPGSCTCGFEAALASSPVTTAKETT
jgi:hypothetical protein